MASKFISLFVGVAVSRHSHRHLLQQFELAAKNKIEFARILILRRSPAFLLCGVLLCGLFGCEEPPRRKVNLESVAGFELDDGERQYRWNVNTGTTELYHIVPIPPTGFGFFENLNPSLFASLDREQIPIATLENAPLPVELDPDVAKIVRLFVDCDPGETKVFQLPADESTHSQGFDVAPDGSHLLTVGSHASVWKLPQGERVVSFPIAPHVQQGAMEPDGKSILTVHTDGIRRYDLKGNILASWQAPSDVVYAAIARNGSRIVVMTEAGEGVLALNQQLKQFRQFVESPLVSLQCSIHPDGKWAVLITEAGITRWGLQDVESTILAYPDGKLSSSPWIHCMSVAEYDCLFDLTGELYVGSEAGRMSYAMKPAPEATDYPLLSLGLIDAQAIDGFGHEGLVACGLRLNLDDQMEYVLCNVDPLFCGTSLPVTLPERPVCLAADQSGQTVALGYADRISVLRYLPWTDEEGQQTIWRLRSLLEDRAEQLELVDQYFASYPFWRLGQTSADVRRMLRRELSVKWHDQEREGGKPIRQLEEWWERGSSLARDVHLGVVYRRAIDLGNQGGARSYDQYERRERLFQGLHEEAEGIIDSGAPTPLAYEYLVFSAVELKQEPYTLEPILERYTRSFPRETSMHNLMFGLLTQNRTYRGESIAYVQSYADLYPPEERDARYALVGATHLGNDLEGERYLRGLTQLMERNEITPRSGKFFFNDTGPYGTGRDMIQSPLGDYFARRFLISSPETLTTDGRFKLLRTTTQVIERLTEFELAQQ